MKIRLFEEYSDGASEINIYEYGEYRFDNRDNDEDFTDDEVNLIRSVSIPNKVIDVKSDFPDKSYLFVRIFPPPKKPNMPKKIDYYIYINKYVDEWYSLKIEDIYSESRNKYYICDQFYSLIDTIKHSVGKNK